MFPRNIKYITAVLLHVVGTQEAEIEVLLCLCTYKVPGTYYVVHTLQKTPTAVVRATAASLVSCCLLYAIHASIDGDGLLLLDVNCIQ